MNEVGAAVEGAMAMAVYMFKLGSALGVILISAALVISGWGTFYFRRGLAWLKRQFYR